MNVLSEIIENKRSEIKLDKENVPVSQLREMQSYNRKCISLRNAILKEDAAVIAEIKKASPSKGVMRHDFDPVKIALDYVKAGASAISILTDKKYFQGDIRFIGNLRPMIPIPILRKDFIIDSYQIIEAKAFGADAILLIAAALDTKQLKELHSEANELGIECLVEVHDENELDKLDLDQVKIIGINNRNLSDFTIDMSTTSRVSVLIPEGIALVSESGIENRFDIEQLVRSGINAVLVGETLMKAAKPGDALRELLTPLNWRTA